MINMDLFAVYVANVNEVLKNQRELNDLEREQLSTLAKRLSELSKMFGESLDIIDSLTHQVLELEREMAELRLKEGLRDSIKVAS